MLDGGREAKVLGPGGTIPGWVECGYLFSLGTNGGGQKHDLELQERPEVRFYFSPLMVLGI